MKKNNKITIDLTLTLNQNNLCTAIDNSSKFSTAKTSEASSNKYEKK